MSNRPKQTIILYHNNNVNFKLLYLLTIFNKAEIKLYVQFLSTKSHFPRNSIFLLFKVPLMSISQNSNYFSQKNGLKANFESDFAVFPRVIKSFLL